MSEERNIHQDIKKLIRDILKENFETRERFGWGDSENTLTTIPGAFHRGKAHGKDDIAARLQEILEKHKD